jgi:hypothetical protein
MKIKHYTFFTDTHKVFLKYFLNTFPFDQDIDLVIRYMPQECSDGEFVKIENNGWLKTMEKKVQYIIDAFDELNEGDIFIHTDADVIFLAPYKDLILEEMGDSDIIFQSDVGTACMGFFACRVSEKAKNIFVTLKNTLDKYYHDQDGINALLRTTQHGLTVKLFSHKIFNHGFFGRRYENEDSVNFPSDIVALHANFTVGIQKKLKLIKLALDFFNK